MARKPISQANRDHSANWGTCQTNFAIAELAKEGKINEARKQFDRLLHKDIISWTSIISAYIKCKMIREARQLFDRSPHKNVITWTAMLSGYIRTNQIHEAEKLFQQMPDKNIVSWNTMILGYTQNNRIWCAYKLFEQMPQKNVVSWNTMITALAQNGEIEEAIKLFNKMGNRDVITWTAMVTGLAKNGMVDEARKLFDTMPEKNVVSWNAMIAGYVQNSQLTEAQSLFNEMPERDIASCNNMITGYIQNGMLDNARRLFREMRERNVVSWTAMITGFAQAGENEKAIKTFARMRRAQVNPNRATYMSLLSSCGCMAGLDEGKQVHQLISKTHWHEDVYVQSALISMYEKCGQIDLAKEIFDCTKKKDVISWNGMIAAYAHHGMGLESIRLFEAMRSLGFEPDDVTYVGVLSACSHSGLVTEGLEYYDSMVETGNVLVREEHYACVVDLLGRAGRLEEAVSFILDLKNRPGACIWGALLGACSVHGDVKIGEFASKRLIEIERENAGTYMLLANIYATVGRWRAAAGVRLKMREEGLKKQPGCSWIEVKNRVNVFVVGDKSHEKAERIYSLLKGLYRHMMRAGYVPSFLPKF
ncbi:hypothetical protein AMTRI_Chr04g190050 [Amborella trichopoda]